jgi:hypothetical protein
MTAPGASIRLEILGSNDIACPAGDGHHRLDGIKEETAKELLKVFAPRRKKITKRITFPLLGFNIFFISSVYQIKKTLIISF